MAPRRPREPRPEPEYATTACPHCAAVLDPLPRAKKKCPTCSRLVYVRTGADGKRYLIREEDRERFQAEYEAQRQTMVVQRATEADRQDEEERAADRERGALIGEESLEVVGESRYRSALSRIVGEGAEGWVERRAVASLLRDEHGVRVEIEGATVGWLSDEDAEGYADLLARLQQQGRPALFRAVVSGKAGRNGVTLVDVPFPDDKV